MALDVDSLPWPGDELAFRVAGGTDREHFYRSGQQSVADIEAMLALVGRSLRDYPSILDFGCGCGRILLWLEHLTPTCTLHGTDIDERAIRWATEHLPWATFTVNDPLPPLPYPDHAFDLVFNHSVFTHIDERHQDLWLTELRRVTKPGGHLLLSVHGDTALQAYEGSMGDTDVRSERDRAGIVHIDRDNFVGGPFPDFYHSTFHAPWYVHNHWGAFFRVVAYVAARSLGFQDFVLLERRPDGDAVAEPPPVERSGPAPATERRGVARVAALLARGPDVSSPARRPWLAAPVRRLVLRAIRHYADYQREVDEALLDAIRDLEGDPQRRDRPLWDALRVHGERVNRLEADVWEAIRHGRDGSG